MISLLCLSKKFLFRDKIFHRESMQRIIASIIGSKKNVVNLI